MFTIAQLKQLSAFLIEEFKEVFVTKEDFQEIKDQINAIQNNIDGFMKTTIKNEQEILVMGNRVNKHDDWIGRAATATGVEYNN